MSSACKKISSFKEINIPVTQRKASNVTETQKKNNTLHMVFGNFSDSSAASHFGGLQVSEPVSTANHSAPTEIKPQTPEQELHLLNAENDLEGKRKDTFLSRIKGEKRWTCSWIDEFL